MIRITQLKLSINHTPEELAHKIRKALRLKNEGFSYEIVKQSLDCRHKDDKNSYTLWTFLCRKKIRKARLSEKFTIIILR